MITAIIVWYITGFISAVICDRLFAWADTWSFGTDMKPFTNGDLVLCLLAGLLGFATAVWTLICFSVMAVMFIWERANVREWMNKPVFGKKKV